MRAMVLQRLPATPGRGGPLEAADIPTPAGGRGDLVVRVSVCGVCRTDLDLVEGRLVAPRYPVIPGHQVIGRVAQVGAGVATFREGDRVGIAWIHSACGKCSWCRTGR